MATKNYPLFTDLELKLIEAIVRQCELFCGPMPKGDCKKWYGMSQQAATNRAITIMIKARNNGN